jgi:hypothetical protein
LLASRQIVEEVLLANVAAGSRLDHHDVGAEVGEDLPRERARHARRQIENQHTVESRVRHRGK